ncbi:MAG: hypothetical protein U5L45_24900 [Saprospiraceae bacterium]|nr:hypothetical protein [Saprospiraceae bacterium]
MKKQKSPLSILRHFYVKTTCKPQNTLNFSKVSVIFSFDKLVCS